MKHLNVHEQNKILEYLNHLPRKIISLHEVENVPEFVLHDFCHDSCFDLSKVAYFVESPDFHHFKGVAGICKRENGFCTIADIWKEPEQFTSYMKNSSFNQKVRTISETDVKNMTSEKDMILDLAHTLGFEHPEYYTWNMKHDNNGLLIFERANKDRCWREEYLHNGAYLLSFCPIC